MLKVPLVVYCNEDGKIYFDSKEEFNQLLGYVYTDGIDEGYMNGYQKGYRDCMNAYGEDSQDFNPFWEPNSAEDFPKKD